MHVTAVGSVCFGLVVGWVAYRTLMRTTEKTSIKDLGIVVAAIGGSILATYIQPGTQFGWYAIGLAVSFFSYALLYLGFNGRESFAKIMGLRKGGSSINRPSINVKRGSGKPREE